MLLILYISIFKEEYLPKRSQRYLQAGNLEGFRIAQEASLLASSWGVLPLLRLAQ